MIGSWLRVRCQSKALLDKGRGATTGCPASAQYESVDRPNQPQAESAEHNIDCHEQTSPCRRIRPALNFRSILPDTLDHQQRETPLAKRIKARIKASGPLPVKDYMEACLFDRDYGYYHEQPAVGSGGDFITAPEVSQVFGELIGAWTAIVWTMMGQPNTCQLVELGPGRATLLSDALRATQRVPGFHAAINISLVERNRALRARQHEVLTKLQKPYRTFASLAELAATILERPQPTIVIANEFLDVFPVAQYVRTEHGLVERCVGLDNDGRFVFVAAADRAGQPRASVKNTSAPIGAIVEHCPAIGEEILAPIAALAPEAPIAALFVDYGYAQQGYGDTLQSVYRHKQVSPFYAPGESDVTCQVDFADLHTQWLRHPSTIALAADGPIPQAAFLGTLGIMERTAQLMQANPHQAGALETGTARLMSPHGMGGNFLVIGLRNSLVPPLPGFPTGGSHQAQVKSELSE